jgi:hypothetical protein
VQEQRGGGVDLLDGASGGPVDVGVGGVVEHQGDGGDGVPDEVGGDDAPGWGGDRLGHP